MIDPGSVASLLGSFSSITSLVSTAIGARDEANRLAATAQILAQLTEAHSKLLALQVAAMQSNEEHATVLRKKRELEEKVRDLERQQGDLSRYELHEVASGVFVYALRKAEGSAGPMHYLCPRCSYDGKKSILQAQPNTYGFRIIFCPVCKQEFNLG